jgi:plastocyanin
MSRHLWRLSAASLLLVVNTAFVVGCSQPATAGRAAPAPTATPTSAVSTSASTSQVIMIPENDIFSPYILVMNAGDRVTWINDDSVAHSVVTVPRAGGGVLDPAAFQLVLAPGQQGSITLRQPGLYHYFCAVHAGLTPQGRAAAFTSVRPCPVAMDGFLYQRVRAAAVAQLLLRSSRAAYTPHSLFR